MSNRTSEKNAAEQSAAVSLWRSGLGQVDRVVALTVIACMGCLVMIVSAQVVLRYVFGASLGWAWEASRLAFVASIFFAIPLGLKERAHVGIDILQQFLPTSFQAPLTVILNVVVIALMLLVSIVGFNATLSTWDQRMSSIPISTGWFYIPVIWSGVHCTLHLIDQSLSLLSGRQGEGAAEL